VIVIVRRLSMVVQFWFLAFIMNPAHAEPIGQPTLSKNKDYSEYWEQQFLFGETLVTSKFLIANFAFSKHHGLMIATLENGKDDAIIIKNGRKRSGWSNDASEPSLTIFQHKLSGSFPGYFMRLHNTAAELDVLYSADTKAIPLIEAGDTLGLPQIDLYAPAARAYGRWRAGPEIGGEGEAGEWLPLGHGFGYGIHVIQQTNPAKSIRRWLRFTALESVGDYKPILHAFETPSGAHRAVLVLVSRFRDPLMFNAVELLPSESGDSWTLHAKSSQGTVTGTLAITNKLSSFNLKDNMNTLEKLVAGSLADSLQQRSKARYQITLNVNGAETDLEGDALVEDILVGKEKAKKRRSRR